MFVSRETKAIAFLLGLGILPAAPRRPSAGRSCVQCRIPRRRGVMLICDNELYAGFMAHVGNTLGGRLICRRIDTQSAFPTSCS